MNLILLIDQQLTIFLKNLFPHCPFFNHLFSFFSLKGYSIIIWILVIVLAIIFEEKKNPGISKKDIKLAVTFTLSFFLTILMVEVFLKNIFQRPRPTYQQQTKIVNIHQFQPLSNCPKNFSFPSGHAATALAGATVLSFFDKRRKWFYYLIALIIAYSRIFLGCHYFFDVLVGGLIGYLITKIINLIVKI